MSKRIIMAALRISIQMTFSLSSLDTSRASELAGGVLEKNPGDDLRLRGWILNRSVSEMRSTHQVAC
jgi:hypothetical protein